MTQSKINKDDIMKKWAPIIESTGVTGSKAGWLSQYAEMHSMNEEIGGIQMGTQSLDFPSVTPMVRRVFSKTVGLDLVSVNPMSSPGGNTSEEMDRIKAEIKSENREGKIESVLEGTEYNEKTVKDHPDYKGPGGHLFYLDYQYGTTQSNKKK